MHEHLFYMLAKERQQRLRQEAEAANLVRAGRKAARAQRREARDDLGARRGDRPATLADPGHNVVPLRQPTFDDAA